MKTITKLIRWFKTKLNPNQVKKWNKEEFRGYKKIAKWMD